MDLREALLHLKKGYQDEKNPLCMYDMTDAAEIVTSHFDELLEALDRPLPGNVQPATYGHLKRIVDYINRDLELHKVPTYRLDNGKLMTAISSTLDADAG